MREAYLMALLALTATGCATDLALLPLCAKPTGQIVESSIGPAVIFDMANIKVMSKMMQDLEARKCRLE